MSKNKLLILGVVIVLVAFGWQLRLRSNQFSENKVIHDVTAISDRSIQRVSTGASTLFVEAVTSPNSISQGLSGRETIGSDGMLFILPERRVPTFWMKEMKFPLDLIWIDGDRVIETTLNVPAPDPATPLDQLPTYVPSEPVTMVLEVPAGQAKARGLLPGAKLSVMIK
jgi:uncharacterized membrane protein (UPF0127 family)